MKKVFILSNLTSICEVAFYASEFVYFLEYSVCWYCKIAPAAVLLYTLSVASCAIAMFYCILQFSIALISGDSEYWDKTHKTLDMIRVQRGNKFHLGARAHFSYFWRHWVFAVNWVQIIGVIVKMVTGGAFWVCAGLCVVQHWQYQEILIPVFVCCGIVLLYRAYGASISGIFRSAAPVVRYLMQSGESLQSITNDFKSAEVVSSWVRIGANHVFVRTKRCTWIINLHCVTQYQLDEHCIKFMHFWDAKYECANFLSRKDYNTVALQLLN